MKKNIKTKNIAIFFGVINLFSVVSGYADSMQLADGNQVTIATVPIEIPTDVFERAIEMHLINSNLKKDFETPEFKSAAIQLEIAIQEKQMQMVEKVTFESEKVLKKVPGIFGAFIREVNELRRKVYKVKELVDTEKWKPLTFADKQGLLQEVSNSGKIRAHLELQQVQAQLNGDDIQLNARIGYVFDLDAWGRGVEKFKWRVKGLVRCKSAFNVKIKGKVKTTSEALEIEPSGPVEFSDIGVCQLGGLNTGDLKRMFPGLFDVSFFMTNLTVQEVLKSKLKDLKQTADLHELILPVVYDVEQASTSLVKSKLDQGTIIGGTRINIDVTDVYFSPIISVVQHGQKRIQLKVRMAADVWFDYLGDPNQALQHSHREQIIREKKYRKNCLKGRIKCITPKFNIQIENYATHAFTPVFAIRASYLDLSAWLTAQLIDEVASNWILRPLVSEDLEVRVMAGPRTDMLLIGIYENHKRIGSISGVIMLNDDLEGVGLTNVVTQSDWQKEKLITYILKILEHFPLGSKLRNALNKDFSEDIDKDLMAEKKPLSDKSLPICDKFGQLGLVEIDFGRPRLESIIAVSDQLHVSAELPTKITSTWKRIETKNKEAREALCQTK